MWLAALLPGQNNSHGKAYKYAHANRIGQVRRTLRETDNYSLFKFPHCRQVWWYTTIIPATQEAKAGGSQIQDQPW
jgi:hypothetical protein